MAVQGIRRGPNARRDLQLIPALRKSYEEIRLEAQLLFGAVCARTISGEEVFPLGFCYRARLRWATNNVLVFIGLLLTLVTPVTLAAQSPGGSITGTVRRKTARWASSTPRRRNSFAIFRSRAAAFTRLL